MSMSSVHALPRNTFFLRQVAGCTQDNELLRGKVATLEESMGAKSSECDAYQVRMLRGAFQSSSAFLSSFDHESRHPLQLSLQYECSIPLED